MLKVYVIIVTYNGMKWMERCLSALSASEYPCEVIIIDNASTDGTAEYVEKHFGHFLLIRSGDNLGFAKANNMGIKIALENDADFVFLLNQDCYVEPATLGELINVGREHPEYGIISPIHLNSDRSGFDHKFSTYIRRTEHILDDCFLKSLKPIYPSKFINAAAWMISKDCLMKVGGFDTMIFYHYGEDDNYCQRVLYHGLKIGMVPSASIVHDRLKSQRPKSFSWEFTMVKIRVFNINLSRKDSLFVFLKCLIHNGWQAFKSLLKLNFKIARVRFLIVVNLLLLYVKTGSKNREINRGTPYAWLSFRPAKTIIL